MDADVTHAATVLSDELLALNERAGPTEARVIYSVLCTALSSLRALVPRNVRYRTVLVSHPQRFQTGRGSTRERGVIALNSCHRIIRQLPDDRLPDVLPELRSSSSLWHPEDVLGPVLVGVFRMSSFADFRKGLLVSFFEGVGDAFGEYQAKRHVFVLCDIRVVARLTSCLPKLLLRT